MPVQGHRMLGEILTEKGYVSLSQVNQARRKQMDSPNMLIGEILMEFEYLTPAQLLDALTSQTVDLYGGLTLPAGVDLCRGLPAKALDVCQLAKLPLFQAIAEQIREGFCIIAWGDRQEDDRFLYVNQTLASWVDMKPEDFVGKPMVSVINFLSRFFKDPNEFLDQVRAAVNRRPQPTTMVWEVTKPKPMEIDVRTVPLLNRAGEYIGTACFLRPITN